jgi:hypothetical protein
MGWGLSHPNLFVENIMDQTKFINSYIANLAEKIKALTLDNIMLSTQLTMANETAAELQNKIQLLENQVNQSTPSGDYSDSGGDLKFDTSEGYSAGNEDVDVDNSSNKKK